MHVSSTLTLSNSSTHSYLCINCFNLKRASPFYHISQYVIFTFFVFFLLESGTHVLNSNGFQKKNSCLFKENDSNFGLEVLVKVPVAFSFWLPEAFLS